MRGGGPGTRKGLTVTFSVKRVVARFGRREGAGGCDGDSGSL